MLSWEKTQECGLCPTEASRDTQPIHVLCNKLVAIIVAASDVLAPVTLRGHQLDPRDKYVIDDINDFEAPPHLSTQHHIAIQTSLRKKRCYRNLHTLSIDYLDSMTCKHGFKAGNEETRVPQLAQAVGAYSHQAHARYVRRSNAPNDEEEPDTMLAKHSYLYQPSFGRFEIEPTEPTTQISLMVNRRSDRVCKYNTTQYRGTDTIRVSVLIGTKYHTTMMRVATTRQLTKP